MVLMPIESTVYPSVIVRSRCPASIFKRMNMVMARVFDNMANGLGTWLFGLVPVPVRIRV
jgi:hypothetical protein